MRCWTTLGIDDPFELTGLYQGVDLAPRSVLDPPAGVDGVPLSPADPG